ncbi:MAG: hypothetical protein JJU05_09155 [Verrucomicrobia bacterium]|nr:hypothetical protein [Verrucomicrobiota bacterium]MCH8527622.1 hypothetical protein [Kiritimatiellia bacterium]
MKKLTRREKRLIPLLPVAVLVIGYMYMAPWKGQIQEVETRLERVRRREITPAELARREAELQTLQRQMLERERLETARLREEESLRRLWGSAEAKRQAAARLHRALQDPGILVIHDRPATASPRLTKTLPARVREQVELRELHFLASYAAADELLSLFADETLPMLPARLEMTADTERGIHPWRLWLWR